MTTNRYTAGERIVQHFIQEGVEILFSQGELSLMDIQQHALKQGLRMVGPRHEEAGVFMAAAYYRMTGVPQVAMGAQGPGAANMLPGAVSCREEHIPVILVGASRQHETTTGVRSGRFLHSETVFPAFNEICKWSGKILHPRQVDEMVQQAFREATNGTPGPVFLEVDYEGHQLEYDYPDIVTPSRYRLTRQLAADAAIGEAVDLILSAKSPMLLVGEEIQSTRTFDDLQKLADLLNCPVTNGMMARGVIRETSPQFIAYSSDVMPEVIDETDVVIAIGTRIPEHVNYGRQRHWAKGDGARKWVMLTADPAAVGLNRPIDVAVLGKLPDSLPQLISALEAEQKVGKLPHAPKLAEWRGRYVEERAARIKDASGKLPMHPYEMMSIARDHVPDDAVIVTECGLTAVYLNDAFEQRSTDYLWNVNFGLLGAGLPHAVGAKLAVGDRPVCLVSGDGGLGVHLMELETAVRHNVPIVIIVNDDQSFAAELAALDAKMGSTPEARFADTRFDKIMETLGGFGAFVERPEDVGPAVDAAFKSGKTAVVQVRVDKDSGLKYLPHGNADLFAWVHEDPSIQRGRP
jgi:thiamine pyrophosphate-dependent acetolactate synthase large subunit-like protein